MSPLLFIVYINDLLNIKCNGSIFSFADDTSIIIDDINKNYIHNKSTHALSIVKTWFDNNLLELNLTKTCFMNFSINKLPPIGKNYLKAHLINCNEFNINTMSAISNDSKCNCTYISSVQQNI